MRPALKPQRQPLAVGRSCGAFDDGHYRGVRRRPRPRSAAERPRHSVSVAPSFSGRWKRQASSAAETVHWVWGRDCARSMIKLTKLLDLRCDIFEALRDFLIRRPEPPSHCCGSSALPCIPRMGRTCLVRRWILLVPPWIDSASGPGSVSLIRAKVPPISKATIWRAERVTLLLVKDDVEEADLSQYRIVVHSGPG